MISKKLCFEFAMNVKCIVQLSINYNNAVFVIDIYGQHFFIYDPPVIFTTYGHK